MSSSVNHHLLAATCPPMPQQRLNVMRLADLKPSMTLSPQSLDYVNTHSAQQQPLIGLHLLLDKIYTETCILIVRLCIIFRNVPILGSLLRRITLMSGSFDTNAMLCLFLRYMYTFMPGPLAFDPLERRFATVFLEFQYFIFARAAHSLSMRLLPPLIRPLYRSYYGRAVYASDFIKRSIEERNVSQIVILGAGYDATAYRTRHMRLTSERSVKVYEVDLPRVQKHKLDLMRRSLSKTELSYYTEEVVYVSCDFGTDSLLKVLLKSGYDTTRASAILWEGVTYYLPRKALEATLGELRQLAALHSPTTARKKSNDLLSTGSLQSPGCDDNSASTVSGSSSSALFRASPSLTLGCEIASPEATTTAGEDSDAESRKISDMDVSNSVWLFLDYMQESKGTLDKAYKAQDKLWQLNTAQAEALGTSFITGFGDVEYELNKFGFKAINHITYTHIEERFFTQVPKSMSVFVEENTTFGHNEPHLNLVECVFDL